MFRKNDRQKLLDSYLKQLYLANIRRHYRDIAHKSRQESLSYEEYLLGLAELECTERRNRRIERYLRESRIPIEKNIDTFDLTRLPAALMQKVKILLDGDFLNYKENVLAFGNPGSGKTHLLCAIGQELIQKGKRVYFALSSLLVQDLLRAKQEFTLGKFFKKLSLFDSIIIDDIGYVQQNREEMEVLFTLLAERYEKGSVMITSNLPFSKWETIFKNPMVTAAAIDRLVHHSVILELNIPSYRIEEAKKKKPL